MPDLNVITQVLLLYTWFPLAFVIFIMLLVARFYQNFSGDYTYYRLYIVPLVLLGMAAVRYASLGLLAGDLFGDALLAVGGLVLLLLSIHLYNRMMMRGKKGEIE